MCLLFLLGWLKYGRDKIESNIWDCMQPSNWHNYSLFLLCLQMWQIVCTAGFIKYCKSKTLQEQWFCHIDGCCVNISERPCFQFWLVCLREGILHGLDLLEVTGHVCGHHHLYDQSPQLPAPPQKNPETQSKSFDHCIVTVSFSCIFLTSSHPCSSWQICSCPPLPSACRQRSHGGSPAPTGHCTEWPPLTWETGVTSRQCSGTEKMQEHICNVG